MPATAMSQEAIYSTLCAVLALTDSIFQIWITSEVAREPRRAHDSDVRISPTDEANPATWVAPAAKSRSLLQVAGWLISLTHDLPSGFALEGYPVHLARFPRCSILVRRMKTMFRSTFVALIFATILFSTGCEKKTAATDPTAQSTPGSTKLLEAADLVGYDGKRLRKSVDRIKEANEKHGQELEKMAGSGPDQ